RLDAPGNLHPGLAALQWPAGPTASLDRPHVARVHPAGALLLGQRTRLVAQNLVIVALPAISHGIGVRRIFMLATRSATAGNLDVVFHEVRDRIAQIVRVTTLRCIGLPKPRRFFRSLTAELDDLHLWQSGELFADFVDRLAYIEIGTAIRGALLRGWRTKRNPRGFQPSPLFAVLPFVPLEAVDASRMVPDPQDRGTIIGKGIVQLRRRSLPVIGCSVILRLRLIVTETHCSNPRSRRSGNRRPKSRYAAVASTVPRISRRCFFVASAAAFPAAFARKRLLYSACRTTRTALWQSRHRSLPPALRSSAPQSLQVIAE